MHLYMWTTEIGHGLNSIIITIIKYLLLARIKKERENKGQGEKAEGSENERDKKLSATFMHFNLFVIYLLANVQLNRQPVSQQKILYAK